MGNRFFNAGMGVLAVSDNDSTVLYKKETNSDAWKHYNNIVRLLKKTGIVRTATQTASSATQTAPAPGALTYGLSASKTNLETSSTGTPPSIESLNVEDTASFAPGGSEPTKADSGSALKDQQKVQKVCLLKARQMTVQHEYIINQYSWIKIQ